MERWNDWPLWQRIVFGIGLAVVAKTAFSVLTHLSPAPATSGRIPLYGAIAGSDKGLWAQASWDYPSEAAASDRALKECEAHTASGDCEVRVVVRDQCAAYAASAIRGVWTVARHERRAQAVATSLDGCRKSGGVQCKVWATTCATDPPSAADQARIDAASAKAAD